MKKLGASSRATFISPYLRRPLRPLDKVLSEREERVDDGTAGPFGDAGAEAAPATLSLSRKAAASD